jgi:hypothetical protein
VNGADFVVPGLAGKDCNGHGTHVSGTIGGTTYGVAKAAILHSVRVFGCTGGAPFSTIIAAVDWVAAMHVKPAVVNMSLGGGFFAPMNTALANLVSYGVFAAVSAGNANVDACGLSPASEPSAYTVSASNISGGADTRALFANTGFWDAAFGPCVDGFAPGHNITSSWFSSDVATAVLSGTSMASPHVAGLAARILSAVKTASPAQVRDFINSAASVGLVANAGAGTPNRLVKQYNRTVAAPGVLTHPVDDITCVVTGLPIGSPNPSGCMNFGPNVNGWVTIILRGTLGQNFNLKVYKWNWATGQWQLHLSKATASNNETLTFEASQAVCSSGTATNDCWFVVEVTTALGAGTYDLLFRKPGI